jgi:hypothetical protein
MNIQNGDKFLFEPKQAGTYRESTLYVVHGKNDDSFRLKDGSRDVGCAYTMRDVNIWLKSTMWKVTYLPAVTKSVSEILDECQDI